MGGWELSELYLKCPNEVEVSVVAGVVQRVRNFRFGVWINMRNISFGRPACRKNERW